MRFIPYVYFLRMPLLLAAAFLLLPVLGLWWSNATRSIIGGMFDLDDPGTLVVSLSALLFGAALTVSTCLVLMYGRLRFFAARLGGDLLDPVRFIGALQIPKIARGFVAGYALCVAALIAGAIQGMGSNGRWHRAGMAVLAVAIFYVTLRVLAKLWLELGSAATRPFAKRLTWTPWGYLRMRPPDVQNAPEPHPDDVSASPAQPAAIGSADQHDTAPPASMPVPPLPATKAQGSQSPIVPPLSNPGLPAAHAGGTPAWRFVEPPELLAGHGFALLMLGTWVLFYLAFAFGRYFRLWSIESHQTAGMWLPVPTLASVILLLGLLLWLFSGLAFLLDRYHIPVLIPVAAVLVFTAQFPESDHFFDVVTLQNSGQLPAYKALEPAPGGLTDSAIVIAASGGGIQAAAWTARVLGGLVEYTQQKKLPDRDLFSKSIRVISSVSGGSVGALFFVDAYNNGVLDRSRTEPVFKAAHASSLDDIAWGLVYPDVFRSVLPILMSPRIDRGWAIETSWLEHLNKAHPSGGTPTLSSWRQDAIAHQRPAVIFNTTLVETGERFLFPTVDLPKADGRRSFRDLEGYEELDVRAVTAARLSATFPYVTPVSRAGCCPPKTRRYHVADGGYYDNFGVASITELLDQATSGTNRANIHRVLLIQISLNKPDGEPNSHSSRGWFFQAFAPVQTLLRMRDAAQLSRNATELRLLTDVLRGRGVELTVAQFPYNKPDRNGCDASVHHKEPDQPLSWHLTPAEIDDIRDTWCSYARDENETRKVMAFLMKGSESAR
jgi:hypothetical protein